MKEEEEEEEGKEEWVEEEEEEEEGKEEWVFVLWCVEEEEEEEEEGGRGVKLTWTMKAKKDAPRARFDKPALCAL